MYHVPCTIRGRGEVWVWRAVASTVEGKMGAEERAEGKKEKAKKARKKKEKSKKASRK